MLNTDSDTRKQEKSAQCLCMQIQSGTGRHGNSWRKFQRLAMNTNEHASAIFIFSFKNQHNGRPKQDNFYTTLMANSLHRLRVRQSLLFSFRSSHAASGRDRLISPVNFLVNQRTCLGLPSKLVGVASPAEDLLGLGTFFVQSFGVQRRQSQSTTTIKSQVITDWGSLALPRVPF